MLIFFLFFCYQGMVLQAQRAFFTQLLTHITMAPTIKRKAPSAPTPAKKVRVFHLSRSSWHSMTLAHTQPCMHSDTLSLFPLFLVSQGCGARARVLLRGGDGRHDRRG